MPSDLLGELLDAMRRHLPGVGVGLADLAVAAAELDGHPLAVEPERRRQAAAEIAGNAPRCQR